jgi:hypothetical protein
MKALMSIALLAAIFSFTAPAPALAAPHENERMSAEGKIRSLHHERDGYHVELDRGGTSFWVPERAVRDRSGDFRIGVSVRLRGVFRDGVVIVDMVDWPFAVPPFEQHRRYETGFVRGAIDRIDYRRDLLVVRDQRTGRLVRADMSACDHRSNRAFERRLLYRGDFIELSGSDWNHDGIFEVARIESVRQRR